MKIGEKYYKVLPATGEPGKQSSPIISAAVTAYARMYLWQLIKMVGVENVYYCDTDSIFTNRTGYEILDQAGYINNTQLGKLKVEGLGSVVLRGPKDYDWIDQESGKMKRTIKGVPASSVDLGHGDYRYKQWETGLTRYAMGSSAEVIINEKIKHLTREYDKGIIGLDGNVYPFVLNEMEDDIFGMKRPRAIIPKKINASSQISKQEERNRVNYIRNMTGLDAFSARGLLKKITALGYDYDTFPWDELDASLTYHEIVEQVQAIGGKVLSSQEEARLLKLYEELKFKAVLDPETYLDELHGVERELMHITMDEG
jgi:hypothetical protein